MFSRVRIAIRFFFVGLAVGVLMAPRSGEQTRDMIRAKAEGLLNNVLEAASMGAEPTPAPTRATGQRARSGNGSAGRARSKASQAADAAADAGEETADAAKEAASEAGV